jgi:hypothetical protein
MECCVGFGLVLKEFCVATLSMKGEWIPFLSRKKGVASQMMRMSEYGL